MIERVIIKIEVRSNKERINTYISRYISIDKKLYAEIGMTEEQHP